MLPVVGQTPMHIHQHLGYGWLRGAKQWQGCESWEVLGGLTEVRAGVLKSVFILFFKSVNPVFLFRFYFVSISFYFVSFRFFL